MNKYLKSIISMIICQMIIYVNILLNEIIFSSGTGKNFYEWGLLLTYIFDNENNCREKIRGSILLLWNTCVSDYRRFICINL